MRTKITAALAASLLLLPGTSAAFSFGTFAPGEQILSVQLASGNLTNPVVTFDGTTNTMVFDASVSTITTNQNTFSIPLGNVIFTSQVTIQSGSELVLQPFPPFFGGQLAAELLNGIAADLSIIDVAVGGGGVLLEGEYDGTLSFQANGPGVAGLPIVGSLDGAFDVTGGDGDFLAAFGPSGNFFANLANFSSGGSPVGGDLCLLIAGGCPIGTTIGDFTVNPNVTITPIPEPGVAALLALGLGGLALRRPARA